MDDLEIVELAARRAATNFSHPLSDALRIFADQIFDLGRERKRRELDAAVERLRTEGGTAQ